MTDTNVVILNGRLTRDSELKYTNTGTAVISFSIAVNKTRRVNGDFKDDTSFFDVILWPGNEYAQAKAAQLYKGRWISITGELKQDRWTVDNTVHAKIKIVAEKIQYLSFPENKKSGQGQQKNQQANQYQSDDYDGDDIPF